MAKKNKNRERAFTVLFMIIVTTIFISVLSFVYLQTQERIKLNEKLRLRKAILYAADIKLPESRKAINELFNQNVKILEDKRIYQITSQNTVNSYVFIQSGPGLWGTITAVIGLEQNLKDMTGIEFIKQNETPGLGARIAEKWFKEQFRNKTGKIDNLVPESEQAGEQEFQAITGATITSTSVRKIINNLIDEAPELIRNTPN